jgi:transcriptional regulator with AAA-type ATPase domain
MEALLSQKLEPPENPVRFSLQKIVLSSPDGVEGLLGSHPSIVRLRERISTVVSLDVNVLIIGDDRNRQGACCKDAS